jgi:ABC-2 type transport system permease protein
MKPSAAAYVRTFLVLARSGLRERMHYKANFLITSLLRGLTALADFLIVAVILMRFRVVDGWDMYEVALLYGLASLGNAIYHVAGREMEQIERYLVSGDFDAILVRPWPTLFTLLARKLDFGRLGNGVQGLAVTVIGVTELTRRGALTGWEHLYLFVIPLTSAAIIFAVALATAAAGFWLIRTDDLQVFTTYAPVTASYYPLSIYPGWLRGMLYTLIPMAFGNYLPVRYLLGKGGSPWVLLLAPVVGVLALWLAYRLWLIGETRYQSTGS